MSDPVPDPAQLSPLGRYGPAATSASVPLHEVHLLAVPVELYRATRQQHDDVIREFTVIGLAQDDQDAAQPAELRRLIHDLSAHYAPVPTLSDDQIERAAESGSSSVDLEYLVPISVMAGADELESLMARADELCAQGRMLTMPRTPQMKAFAHWWLEELRRQVSGLPPTPWPQTGHTTR